MDGLIEIVGMAALAFCIYYVFVYLTGKKG